MSLITESWRSYVCTVCKLQCDVTGEGARTGRPMACPDCVVRGEMVPQGPAWTAVRETSADLFVGSRGSLLEVCTVIANALVDIRNIMEAKRDPIESPIPEFPTDGR